MQKALLQELINAGAVRTLLAQGVPGGYVLAVTTEAGQKMLTAQRGHARVFRSLDALAALVRDLGAVQFVVDLSQWNERGLV